MACVVRLGKHRHVAWLLLGCRGFRVCQYVYRREIVVLDSFECTTNTTFRMGENIASVVVFRPVAPFLAE